MLLDSILLYYHKLANIPYLGFLLLQLYKLKQKRKVVCEETQHYSHPTRYLSKNNESSEQVQFLE